MTDLGGPIRLRWAPARGSSPGRSRGHTGSPPWVQRWPPEDCELEKRPLDLGGDTRGLSGLEPVVVPTHPTSLRVRHTNPRPVECHLGRNPRTFRAPAGG